ncbi:MAG: hypothetical protein ACLGPL_04870, partial [Acidobacteriota bacterium]
TFEGVRLFASSCTIENVQIKDCRTALNRAYHHLARLEPDSLADCPFLTEIDGIYTITLAFIPEKYRLDVQRSEEIVRRNVGLWLSVLEKAPEGREEIIPGLFIVK